MATDLREDWAGALRANGFRADVPTHWVDEGVLGYLLREDAMRVVRTLTDLSAPGSHFGLAEFDTTQHSERYTELRRLVRAGADGPRGPVGSDPTPNGGSPRTDGGPRSGPGTIWWRRSIVRPPWAAGISD
ncbi:class I SAM-dependent methyltransferase [Nocardia gipuzkoensis]